MDGIAFQSFSADLRERTIEIRISPKEMTEESERERKKSVDEARKMSLAIARFWIEVSTNPDRYRSLLIEKIAHHSQRLSASQGLGGRGSFVGILFAVMELTDSFIGGLESFQDRMPKLIEIVKGREFNRSRELIERAIECLTTSSFQERKELASCFHFDGPVALHVRLKDAYRIVSSRFRNEMGFSLKDLWWELGFEEHISDGSKSRHLWVTYGRKERAGDRTRGIKLLLSDDTLPLEIGVCCRELLVALDFVVAGKEIAIVITPIQESGSLYNGAGNVQ